MPASWQIMANHFNSIHSSSKITSNHGYVSYYSRTCVPNRELAMLKSKPCSHPWFHWAVLSSHSLPCESVGLLRASISTSRAVIPTGAGSHGYLHAGVHSKGQQQIQTTINSQMCCQWFFPWHFPDFWSTRHFLDNRQIPQHFPCFPDKRSPSIYPHQPFRQLLFSC